MVARHFQSELELEVFYSPSESLPEVGMRLQGWTVQPCESKFADWTCRLERDVVTPRWLVWTPKESLSRTIPNIFTVTRTKAKDGTK